MSTYIVLSTGGTGGHVYPALSLAAELKKQGFITELVTDMRGAIYQESDYFDHVAVLNLPKAVGVLGKIRQALYILLSAMELAFKFTSNRPSMVIGFGGYTSAPVIIAAILLRIPIIIHEQNAVLGRVNRLMGKFARKIALGMPVTRYAKAAKSVFVGNPVRQAILDVQGKTWPSEKIRLFVFGGSQGADLFGRVVPQAIALLPPAMQEKLIIVHQVRDEIRDSTLAVYDQTKIHLEALQPFFSDMPKRLSEADLIVGRAGAMTVTEISVVGRAAIFIPLKIAMDNHQYWNVKPMVDAGAAEMILETDLTPQLLVDKLMVLIESIELRQTLATKISQFCVPDSVEKFADLIKNELKDI
ncbi:UDP-N-acetylglucosamine--N-acetylmuramyl-(pentapeptide) pyrophosphoryl-undecaprenol N-acetylglucosamine transferase [Candidatus Odyssella acanthamoebae]|uniref:UDP-N-acetylglucosamine--N-acetylmuramyl- (pentapeptide) pyrophosphoryl-undecaprenol N-acetylglucosamine transferase n=1 Tax=Candidatus Odyssella acanthamoebae TaxID=91604 RepID=UPI00068E2A05|nr:UDP-N-acetylglucosamine--N-acetylmuramyl-(pentapeptide) pyrophosphoryl-undecaprenol N-acetylglucosamine transferase [Candidatus Paracaedibacter acanthamoebae]